MTESDLQTQVADYLRLQYPDVLFHSDFGSGTKLTPGQAMKQKRQNGGRRAWPDLTIAEPGYIYLTWAELEDNTLVSIKQHSGSGGGVNGVSFDFNGLYLELKKEGTRLKKKNGDWATEHIAEQSKILGQLRDRGYCAEFAVGFEEAKKIIDEYLGGE